MEIRKLKNTAKMIKMPEDVRERIAVRTEKALMQEKTTRRMKRPALIAAVIAACICLSAVGVAVGNGGFFRDITRWDGAVIGTAYEQATEEIAVSAAVEGDTLKVEAVLLVPERAPYSEIETLAVGNWGITDESGTEVAEGENSAAVSISGGMAEFEIPLTEISSGKYTLKIDSFTGDKKADQPLGISGAWSCAFEIP